MTNLELFYEKFNTFHHFETFQEHFAKIGILCYIMPDWYKTGYGNLAWRGLMNYTLFNDESDVGNEWYEDDCGSYASIHECRTATMKMVIEFCLDKKINFL